MLRTMNTATNTMNQLQKRIDIIGNNLSNSQTHGYKSNEASFQELLYQQFQNDKLDQAPRQSPSGIRFGVGAMLAQSQMNWSVGTLQYTERSLDFALTSPKQYFNIIAPGENGDQTVFTRKGNFYVSPIGNDQLMLVTDEGYPVASSAGTPIVFNDNVRSYSVQDGGRLEVTQNDGTVQNFEFGITVFERPNLMTRLSATNFAMPENLNELNLTAGEIVTDLIGQNRNAIGIEQATLEASNVKYDKELTDLINVQRSYQFNARTVTLADQMLGLINSIR